MKYLIVAVVAVYLVGVQSYEQGHADAIRQSTDVIVSRNPVVLDEREKLNQCTSELFALREFILSIDFF